MANECCSVPADEAVFACVTCHVPKPGSAFVWQRHPSAGYCRRHACKDCDAERRSVGQLAAWVRKRTALGVSPSPGVVRRAARKSGQNVVMRIDSLREELRSELLYFLRLFEHIPPLELQAAERTIDGWAQTRPDVWWQDAWRHVELGTLAAEALPEWVAYDPFRHRLTRLRYGRAVA